MKWLWDVQRAVATSTTARGLVLKLGRALPLNRIELSMTDPKRGLELTLAESSRSVPTRVPLSSGELRLFFRSDADRPRPEDLEVLSALVSTALAYIARIEKLARVSRTSHDERRELLKTLGFDAAGDFVARSDAMLDVLRQVHVVAGYDTGVLLRGESGTGKELVAKRIHQLSPRARGPFVALNCGAIPAALEESELFGHEAGAFTGASRRHVGRFQRAAGGTLFLDEVAELSASAQVKLLRALQERQIEPVGAERTLDVDVRVIAATHQPLEALIAEGRFRSDLYFRLNVFPLTLPPLRERKDDVPALTQAILRRLGARLGLPVPSVPSEVMQALCDYAWPGNVRELENVLERAVIQTAPGERLSSVDLPATFELDDGAVESLESTNRVAIRRALHACHGRIYGPNGAADRLGLKPGTLQSRMKKLGIDRKEFVPNSR